MTEHRVAMTSRPDVLSSALAVGAFLVPIMAALAPKGLVILFAALALVALAGLIRRPHVMSRGLAAAMEALPSRLSLPIAGLAAWGALSALWSLNPPGALGVATTVIAFLVAGASLAEGMRRQATAVARALVPGVMIGAALILVQGLFLDEMLDVARAVSGRLPTPDAYLDRSAALIGLMTWPALTTVWHRRGTKLTVILATAAALVVDANMATRIAFLAGGATAAAAFLFPRAIPAAAAAVTAGIVLLAPVGAAHLPSVTHIEEPKGSPRASLEHRALIWRFAAERIAERPVIGWGLDSARVIPGGDIELEPAVPYMPLHPHNAALQIWMELGAPGALFTALLLAMLCWRLHDGSDRLSTALGLGLVVNAAGIALLSFGIWQSWWLAGLWLVATLMTAAGRSRAHGKGASP